MNVKNKGRAYTSGKSCHDDLKWLIISKCLEHGGDPANCFLLVAFNTIAQETGVATNTVRKIWNQFYSTRTLTPSSKGGDFCSKLSAGDLQLIETLKTMRGSISFKELQAVLADIGDVQDISLSALSKAIKSKLLSGKRYSRKKITHVAKERLKTPDCGTRLDGNSPVGERCVEISRKVESPNYTLNLLLSLNGAEYFNTIDGPTNTVEFWNFFEEAANAANITTGRPALEVGDIVVMDNLAVHHYAPLRRGRGIGTIPS